jgi:uncharacterized protein (TIGR00251 family)
MTSSWQKAILSQDTSIVFWVKASPQATKNEILGIEQVSEQQHAIKIKIKAKPIDGAANEALIKYLAEILGLRMNAIELISGQGSRIKRLKCQGIEREQAIAKLSQA